MILWLRSLLFTLGLVLLTVILGIIYLPLLLAPKRWIWPAATFWARLVLAWLRLTVGIRHTIEDQQHILQQVKNQPFIFAVQHQSAWETLALMVILPRCRYVLKQELLWLPIYGWYCWKAGMIPLNRQGGSKSLKKMLRAAQETLAHGNSIVIFPEGTRVKPGENVPYQPGIAALYKHCPTQAIPAPVIPVRVNSGLFWGKNSFIKRPGVITLTFLPAIEPGLEKTAFLEKLREEIRGDPSI